MDRQKQPSSGALLPNDKQPKQVIKSGTDATVATYSTVDGNCILFGRGKACNNHSANKRMRLVIDGYRNDYQTAGRGSKKRLVHKVHEELIEAGMKFLKHEEGIDGWIEADADEAIKKVGHALRCHRNSSHNEVASKDQPNVARVVPAAVGPYASVPGQVLQPNLVEVVQQHLASPLALPSLSTATRAGFLSSSTAGHREILGLPLSIASNPLLALGIIPMPMYPTSLYAGAQTSMGLAAPSPFVSLPGVSSVELYVMIERERQLQAMLRHHILRNSEYH